jgi:anti-sigma regulatory factor (Ser/Thr protein kinase)
MEVPPVRREVILSATPAAAMRARVALNDAIPPPELADRFDDARLAMTEIVSNVLAHGHLAVGDAIRLIIDADDDYVRVEVEQPSPAKGVHSIPPRMHAERPGGFGLRLVEATADVWGVEEGPPGHVWFEFRR